VYDWIKPSVKNGLGYFSESSKPYSKKLTEEYQRCLTGMNQVLELSWQIANNNNKNSDQALNDDKMLIIKGVCLK
jgi:hypothetical protein